MFVVHGGAGEESAATTPTLEHRLIPAVFGLYRGDIPQRLLRIYHFLLFLQAQIDYRRLL